MGIELKKEDLMYNYAMLIGRLCQDVEVKNTVDGKRVSTLTLAVTRPFKNNLTGEFDTDFIDITVWDALCDIAATYLKKGSRLAVKGRLVTKKITLESGAIINNLELVGEKVIFISSELKEQAEAM